MEINRQIRLYRMYNLMQKRVWELEGALKALIEDHKSFQIPQELDKYESVLNRRLADEIIRDWEKERASVAECYQA